MKKMKKSLSLMMVVMMMVSMTAMTVFGATGSITINGTDGASIEGVNFDVYLIATGDWVDDDKRDEMNYKIMGSNYLSEIWTESGYKDLGDYFNVATMAKWMAVEATNDQKANIISKWAEIAVIKDSPVTNETGGSSNTLTISDLETGYYMVLSDDYPPMTLHTTEEISIKADYPTMTKWIQHNDVSEKDEGVPGISEGWGVVGDNQIGDNVYFKLEVTLPEIYTNYKSYVYVLADAMDSSLKFNQDSLKIYMGEDEDKPEAVALYEEGESGLTLTDYVSALYQDDDGFVYGIDVLAMYKAMTDEASVLDFEDYVTMYVYYDATLTEEAVIYEGNQVNSAALIYSKTSNTQPELTTGETILGVLEEAFDGDEDLFQDIVDGAEDVDGKDTSELLEEFVKDKLEEDEDTEFGSLGTTGDHVYDYTFQLELIKVDGNAAETPGATFKLFDVDSNPINVTGNGTNTIYTVDLDQDDSNGSNEIYMGEDGAGRITIVGLDDAVVYGLQETEAPYGLQMVEDAPFYFMLTVEYQTNSGQEYLVDSTKITEYIINEDGEAEEATEKTSFVNWGDNDSEEAGLVSSDEISVTVVNQSGSLLPSTGGMGTVIFQVAGAGMVLAAGALLVMKKKQS